ncbi:MAG TPA: histidinol-phosphatase [Gemmatimonadaceae bacterium]|nr:histidinol-phosphatase [Gemmatimonadaceae bacterium]
MRLSHESMLDAVNEVARLTGDVALGMFASDIAVETKDDGSPVTRADRAAESIARDWIAKRFPDHGVLGEEFAAVNPDAELRWIIDPIDGTASFIRGVPLWGTLIALARGEDILAGAIYCPAVREMVCAARGLGAWWNGSRAQVSSVATLGDALLLTADSTFAQHPARGASWQTLTTASSLNRGWCDCYGYLLVATGRAEVMVDPVLAPWDAAALYPVISEAGGVITDWTGRATAFGDGCIATNGALAQEVRLRLGAS